MQVTSQEDPAKEITYFERMGLNGLSSSSLILARGQAFRGREGISLLVHAYYHTLAYSMFFSLTLFSILSFFSVFTLLFRCFLQYYHVLSCLLILLLLFLVHGRGPFYTSCRDGFLLFYPLIAFLYLWVSFQTTHWSISCPAIITYLCWPCYIPLPNKESYFICLFTVTFPSR